MILIRFTVWAYEDSRPHDGSPGMPYISLVYGKHATARKNFALKNPSPFVFRLKTFHSTNCAQLKVKIRTVVQYATKLKNLAFGVRLTGYVIHTPEQHFLKSSSDRLEVN